MNGVQTATVVHVDINSAFRALLPDRGTDSLLAVFWDGLLPLGSRLFTSGELPVSAAALPAVMAAAVAPALVARGLTSLEGLSVPTAPSDLKISVVVCTSNRPLDLARCLDSLTACDPAPDEIVIVDNSPDNPATRDLVMSRAGLRYVAEPRRGLSRARNAGVAAATGHFIAFTDDDVTVTSNWMTPIRAGFADPGVAVVSGLVLPMQLDSAAAVAFEINYGGLAGSFLPTRYDRSLLDTAFGEAPPVWKVGAGANMAFRRTALARAGPFDERLGAGAAGCSEDSEMVYRLLLAGGICVYDPAAVVFHRHRDTVSALRQQLRAYMRGHVAALFVQYGHDRAPGNLVRAFVGMPIGLAGGFVMTFWHRERLRRQLLPWETLGVVEGWLSLLRLRKTRPVPSISKEPP